MKSSWKIQKSSKINIFSLKQKGFLLFFIELGALFYPDKTENEDLFSRSLFFFLNERFSVTYLLKIRMNWKLQPESFIYFFVSKFIL